MFRCVVRLVVDNESWDWSFGYIKESWKGQSNAGGSESTHVVDLFATKRDSSLRAQ